MEIARAKELVANYKKDRNKVIEEIYNETINMVYRYAYMRLGKKEWVEDVVSETYMTLIEIIEKYNGESKIETFIIGIANNKINQFFSKLTNQGVDFDENMIIEKDEDDFENSNILTKEKLDKVIKELSPEYRNILENRFIKNLNIKQTAKVMEISEANVRVLQHRAIKKASEIANRLFVKDFEK